MDHVDLMLKSEPYNLCGLRKIILSARFPDRDHLVGIFQVHGVRFTIALDEQVVRPSFFADR
jgi:hypothetical protein